MSGCQHAGNKQDNAKARARQQRDRGRLNSHMSVLTSLESVSKDPPGN
jgi:hypothetical protein